MKKSEKQAANVFFRVAIFWLSIVFVGAMFFYLVIQYPDIFRFYSIENYKAVITTFSAFCVMLGLALFISYLHKSSIFETFFDFKLLAHWIYDPGDNERKKLFRQRFTNSRFKNSLIFGTIAGSLIAGITVWSSGDTKLAVLVSLAASCIVLLGSIIISKMATKIKMELQGEAFISLDGIYSDGELIPFKGLDYRLEKVEYLVDGSGSILKFKVSHSVAFKRAMIVVYVDVPPGSESDAEKISYILNAFPDDNFAFFEPFKNYSTNLFFASDGLVAIERKSARKWDAAIFSVWFFAVLTAIGLYFSIRSINEDNNYRRMSENGQRKQELLNMEFARNSEPPTSNNMQLDPSFAWEYLVSVQMFDQESFPADIKVNEGKSIFIATTSNIFMKSSLNNDNKVKINIISKISNVSLSGRKIWELTLPDKVIAKRLAINNDGSGEVICKTTDLVSNSNDDRFDIFFFNNSGKITHTSSFHSHENNLEIFEFYKLSNNKYEALATINNHSACFYLDSSCKIVDEHIFSSKDSLVYQDLKKINSGNYYTAFIDASGNNFVNFYTSDGKLIKSNLIKNINAIESNSIAYFPSKGGFTKIITKVSTNPIKSDLIISDLQINENISNVSKIISNSIITPKCYSFDSNTGLLVGISRTSVYSDNKIAVCQPLGEYVTPKIFGRRNVDYIPAFVTRCGKDEILILSRKIYKSNKLDDNDIIDDVSLIKYKLK